MANTIKHILVIRLSALGDVAMAVPVLNAFQDKYPEIKFTVLTQTHFAPLLNELSKGTILEAELRRKHKGIIGMFKLSKEIRKLNVSAIVDLHGVLRSNILKCYLKGIPFVQINKGRKEKKALINGSIFKQLKTTHQRYADVFGMLGFQIDLSKPLLLKKKKMGLILKKHIDFDTSKPLIGIAPFAAYKSKEYPMNLMEQIIKEFSKSCKIVLFGGGVSETEILNNLSKRYNNTVSLCGRFDLSEELKVISNLDVMLSMDSGNAHIAAMYGVEVVTLWGVTHPFAGFYPINQNPSNAILANRSIYPKIPTSVYGRKYPSSYLNAMASIPPQRIIQKIKDLINTKAAQTSS